MADGPKLTALGKIVIVLFIIGCFAGAIYMLGHRFGGNLGKGGGTGVSLPSAGSLFGGGGVNAEIGIAYGTEKKRWLEWAVEQFNQTSDGKNIKSQLDSDGIHRRRTCPARRRSTDQCLVARQRHL